MMMINIVFVLFQSTPSVGRATLIVIVCLSLFNDIDPRPPWGGRLVRLVVNRGADKFQSTSSVGRATAKIYKYAMLCLYIVHIKLYIFATAVLFI